jgi:chlorobactene glucosyltransferase
MTPFFILSTFAFFIGIYLVYWIHSRHRMDIIVQSLQPPDSPTPFLSVIVPARNEERNIGRCVEALPNQNYPGYEVLVLDDRSNDSTAQILQRCLVKDDKNRLHIIPGVELPQGWAGKPHALYQAARQAQGEWLCFVDADTFVMPEALASTMRTAVEQRADLLTILTDQELGTFWEKVILPVVFTALAVGFPPRKVNDPKSDDAIANGQFILIRREVYENTGGHAAVKGSIVEDKDLARVVKGAGYHLIIADGRAMATTRMYTSLREMWEGWTKNMYLGLKGSPEMVVLGAFGAALALFAALVLPLWPLAGLTWLLLGGGLPAWFTISESLTLWGYLLAVRVLAARAFHIHGWYGLTLPLGAAIFAAMMIVSAYKVLSGQGVSWKGRNYEIGRK